MSMDDSFCLLQLEPDRPERISMMAKLKNPCKIIIMLTFHFQALTYRVGHHSTSDDSTKYRAKDEIKHWNTARNPITRYRKWVERNKWWSQGEESELRGTVRKQLMQAIQIAEQTEKPPLTDLFTDVYYKMPSNLQEQERSLRETIKKHLQDYPLALFYETLN